MYTVITLLWLFYCVISSCVNIYYSYIIVYSNQNALTTTDEGDIPNHPQSPIHAPQDVPAVESNVSSSAVPEYGESKQDTSLQPESHHYSMIHTPPSYSFGYMPPVVGSQLAPFESSDSQARDVSRLPSFVVSLCFLFPSVDYFWRLISLIKHSFENNNNNKSHIESIMFLELISFFSRLASGGLTMWLISCFLYHVS